MASENIKNVKINNGYWDISADIHFPANFDEKKKYPAIISAHPIGSCKEQTSGNMYGKALAKEGFVVIAFKAIAAANRAASKTLFFESRTSIKSQTIS